MRKLAPEHLKTLSRNIGRLRNKADLTQELAAEKAGISSRFYQSIEAGEQCPSVQVLINLRRIFDCSWEEIFAGVK